MKIIVVFIFWVSSILYPLSLLAQTINWTNDRGGTGSGSMIGSNWTISKLPLQPGLNNITVTYSDESGNPAQDMITVTYAPSFPGNTLAGAWAFEEPSGISATDSSGNLNTGTLINTATTVANGRFLRGISLNGTNQYVSVPDANSLDFTQSFTFSAWVFPTVSHTNWRAVIVKQSMIGLYASSDYCGAGTPAVFFVANGILGPVYYACYASPLPVNQWTHLAATYDGADLKLYTDGTLRTTLAATGYIEPSDLPLTIGASAFPNEYFQGVLDEPRVYNWAIPLGAGSNSAPGATCTAANFADNVTSPSIIGNMNCPIISPVPPLTIKIPGSASGLKVGAAASGLKFGTR